MSQTYPSSLYATIASVQEDHFWFTARSRMLTSFIQKEIPHHVGMKLLEIGCGTGIVMEKLEQMGFICTGLDINRQALVYAGRRTRGDLIRQSIFQYKPGKRYDVVGAFDVLEHIGDDVNFLKSCYRLLRPKGYVLLTVPAGMWLWSSVDRASGHVRRYEYNELSQKLKNAGFTVRSLVYWNSLLLPLYELWHRRSGLSKHDVVSAHLQKMPRVINTLLAWIFYMEHILSKYIRFPSGATLVVCAQKGSKQ